MTDQDEVYKEAAKRYAHSISAKQEADPTIVANAFLAGINYFKTNIAGWDAVYERMRKEQKKE